MRASGSIPKVASERSQAWKSPTSLGAAGRWALGKDTQILAQRTERAHSPCIVPPFLAGLKIEPPHHGTERFGPVRHEAVAGAASAGGIADQDGFFLQIVDVARRGVLRTFGESRIFRRAQLALEAVQQPVDDLPLPVVQRIAGMGFPEPRLAQHRSQGRLGAAEGAIQATKEPGQPAGYVQFPLLSAFERVVIGGSLKADLGRHAVEALSRLFRTGEGHVGDGVRDTTVSVFEWMDGDEPEMSDGGENYRILVEKRIEPVEKVAHLLRDPRGAGGLEMSPLTPDPARYDLHRSGFCRPPGADHDLSQPAAAGGKQSGMPAEQLRFRQGISEILDRIEHHLDDTFDVAVFARQSATLHTQTARQGGANLIAVEMLTLDLTGFQDFFGQRTQYRFGAELKTEPFHPPNQPSLMIPH
jgi:hypothetical protein